MIDSPLRPYPGLVPFQDTETDRMLFFGRETEADDLCHMVLSQALSVLYARSGVGKSSLLNAGLMRRLRANGVFPAIVRLTFSHEHTATDAVILGVCAEAQKQQLRLREVRSHGATLWEFFAFTEFVSASGEVVRPVLIIDQFEELFTIIRGADHAAEEAFVNQFADLVRGRVPDAIRLSLEQELERSPDGTNQRAMLLALLYGHSAPGVHVLLALREDYLPELESLRAVIPTIFQATYRLTPLSHAAARAAIEQPPKTIAAMGRPSLAFEEGVVDEIMEFLTISRSHRKTTRSELVEPAHLQIVCAELDRRRIKKNRDRITRRDLNGLRGMRRILKRHYKLALRAFPRLRFFPHIGGRRLYHRPRAAIRRLCEGGLLTKGGQRNTLMRDAIMEQFHVTDDDLQKLIKLCIVRADWRLDAQFFELSHDALLDPIRAARRWRIWRRRTAIALSALFGPIILFFVIGFIIIWRHEEGLRARLVTATTAEVRGEVLKQIVRSGMNRDLAGADLRGVAAEEIEITGFNMERARLSSARLDRSTISDTSLSAANIDNATFVGSRIQGGNFTRANGRGSDFSAATIAANFAEADLTNARFVETSLDDDATFTGARIDGTDFSGTAWWLATGWSADNVARLGAQFPPGGLLQSSAYHSHRARLDNDVVKARRQGRNLNLSRALNGRAWFRAIRGVELDLALSDANEANAITSRDSVLDTRGYILLQIDRCDEALRDLSEALIASGEFGKGAAPTMPGGSLLAKERLGDSSPHVYRYALALRYTGRAAEAERWFQFSERLGYVPTHELLLLPRDGDCSSVAKRTMASPAAFGQTAASRPAS